MLKLCDYENGLQDIQKHSIKELNSIRDYSQAWVEQQNLICFFCSKGFSI